MIVIGEMSLWVALLMATWAATVSLAGGIFKRGDLTLSGERAIHATLGMVALASAGLWSAFFRHDFSIEYVASHSTANLPKIYTVAAFWAGEAGSILFSALILAMCSAVVVFVNRAKDRAPMPYVSAALAVVLIFLLALSSLGANPFRRLDYAPLDGQGLNPELQNPGMVIHPPVLYFGYLATAIPFAFTIAALATRRFDADWLTSIRKWSLIAWLAMTIGIVAGMWWSYIEPDRGSYWRWDAAEIFSLLSWIGITALLYSILARGKRTLSAARLVVLSVATFLVSLSGTFFMRSADVARAPSYAGPPLQFWIVGFITLLAVASAYLVASRKRDLAGNGDAFANAVTRERRHYGLYIVLAGGAVMCAGFAGGALRKGFDVTLRDGDSRQLVDPFGHRWTVVSQGLSRYSLLNREVTALTLDLSRDGKRAGIVSTEKRQHVDVRGAPAFAPSTEAGIRSSWTEDVYVALLDIAEDQTTRVRVIFRPFVRLVWLGGGLMVAAGLLFMWPRFEGHDS